MSNIGSSSINLFLSLLWQIEVTIRWINLLFDSFLLHADKYSLIWLICKRGYVVFGLVLKSYAFKSFCFTLSVVLLVHIPFPPKVTIALLHERTLFFTLEKTVLRGTILFGFWGFEDLLQHLKRSHIKFCETTIGP